ncbi:hypothetical protein CB1_000297010 [Camelus ferus]|nr:hypothetical protein CB1_000297010 [Camelus ferus]
MTAPSRLQIAGGGSPRSRSQNGGYGRKFRSRRGPGKRASRKSSGSDDAVEKTCRHSFYNKQCVAQEEHRALLAKVPPTSNANSKMTTTQDCDASFMSPRSPPHQSKILRVAWGPFHLPVNVITKQQHEGAGPTSVHKKCF